MAASAVVAAGATSGLFQPRLQLDRGGVWLVRIAAVLAAAAGVAGLVVQRSRLRSSEDRHYDPSISALGTAGTIMLVLALLGLLAPDVTMQPDSGLRAAAGDSAGMSDEAARRPPGGSGSLRDPGISGGFGFFVKAADRRGRARERQAGEEGESERRGFDWSFLDPFRRALLLALLFAIATFGILSITGRLKPRQSEEQSEAAVAAADVAATLEASLSDVAYDGPDPRRQIISAYHRLLAALAAAGAPQEPHEAPHEHLHRVLEPLGVEPEPMHQLSELYVLAHFSDHPVTEQHRAAAGQALEHALTSLRAQPAANSGSVLVHV